MLPEKGAISQGTTGCPEHPLPSPLNGSLLLSHYDEERSVPRGRAQPCTPAPAPDPFICLFTHVYIPTGSAVPSMPAANTMDRGPMPTDPAIYSPASPPLQPFSIATWSHVPPQAGSCPRLWPHLPLLSLSVLLRPQEPHPSPAHTHLPSFRGSANAGPFPGLLCPPPDST